MKHHLLLEFIRRDIKGRFAGTGLGILWSLFIPIVNILIFIFIFSLVLRVKVSYSENGTDNFIVYFLSGYFPWLCFSESMNRSVGILVDNANLITKVVFPVEYLPIGAVVSTFILNNIGMAFFLFYLYYMDFFHLSWILVFAVIPVQAAFTVGLTNLIASLCVFLRDTRELTGILLSVWFYATPIIYPISMVPEDLRPVIYWNPMYLFVSLYREVLILHEVNLFKMLLCCLISITTFLFGTWILKKLKPSFGDVL